MNVLAAFSNDPHESVRSVAKEMDISHTSVHRILKKNDLHPYKLHYVQGLKPSDPDRRLQYISIIMALSIVITLITGMDQIHSGHESRMHKFAGLLMRGVV